MALARVPAPNRPVRAGNGRYEVGQLLGRGGMAEVFDGRSLGSHGFEKRVAIKRILPELAGDSSFTSRLVVEAKLAVAMQHVNIVQALDLVRDGHDVFLVMEFVNGPTLRRILQERYATGAGPLPVGLSSFILHEAAAGLDYAHTQAGGAVIHADISPSNLLISRAGEVKLADFGIARREGIARAAEGKWGYMAPEQERGEALSPRADLYALGVVLYELLTGVHPFSHRSPRSPLVIEPAISPHIVRPSLPRAISELCMQMLAPAVADRVASAKEVVERLAEMRYREGWREARSELSAIIAQLVPEQPALPPSAATSMSLSIPSGPSGMSGPTGATGPTGSMGPPRPPGLAGAFANPPTASMSGSLPAFGTFGASLPPRQATEHTQAPLRQATEMTNRPLTLVTSSLLVDSGELLGPAGTAVGTATAGQLQGQAQGREPSVSGLGAVLHSPVPGALAAVGPSHVLHSPVPGALAGVVTPQGGLVDALANGTWNNNPVTFTAPGKRPLVSVRTWMVLGLATLAGVLWGVRSVVREISSAPAPVVAPPAPEAARGAERPAAPGQLQGGAEAVAGTSSAPVAGSAAGTSSAPVAGSAAGTSSGPVAGSGTSSAPEAGGATRPERGTHSSKPSSGSSQSSAQPRPEAASDGTLRVYAEPWAYVQVGDVKMETPARLTLRPGRHVVKLTNPELGLTRTETVRIRSKEMTTLKVRWNE